MLLVAFDRFCFVVYKKQGKNTRILIYPSFVGCFHPRTFDIQGIVQKARTEGHIMSESIYEIINFPKYHQKSLTDFCPGRFYRLGTCDLF